MHTIFSNFCSISSSLTIAFGFFFSKKSQYLAKISGECETFPEVGVLITLLKLCY